MKEKGIINLNFDEVIQEFALSKKQGEKLCSLAVQAVTYEIAENWKKIAGRTLKSTRSAYINSIVVIEEGKFKNAIVLKGSFNNMLESGTSSYDMKAFFMKSAKIKMSAKGKWYLRIPFRFSTPGALGENSAFSNSMPKEVYAVLKGKVGKQTDLGGASKSGKGLTKDEIPSKFRDAITKKDRDGFGDYTHKSSIYEGITKSTKEMEAKTGSKYNSFRTVGEASDASAWIHPGLKAGNFADKALKETDVDTLVNNLTDKFLASL